MPLSDARGVATPAKIRVRFGVRGLIPFFPNAGIQTGYVTQKQFLEIKSKLTDLRTAVSLSGNENLIKVAEALFIEQG